MTVVIKDVKRDSFTAEWPNRRTAQPVMKYTMRDTEIHLQHSNIITELRVALEALFSADELEREAQRRCSSRLARMSIFTETYYHNGNLVIRYTKVQLPDTIEHRICYHLMESGWRYTGYHMIKFRGLFQKIANTEGWERGVYMEDGSPTKNPIFAIKSSSEEILVTAPFGELSENKFLKVFRLGQSPKSKKIASKY